MILESFRREYRAHRMARFAVWIAAYGAALWLVNRFTRAGAPGPLWFLFWIAFLPIAVYYLFRLTGFVKRRVLWRLRRRLIVTYVFIAVVPILLILTLVGLGAYILDGQFASFLVASKLRNRADQLQQLDRVVIHQADHFRATTSEALLDHLCNFVNADLSEHTSSYPGLEVTLRVGSLARAFRLDGETLTQPVTVPAWLNRRQFAGIVMDEGEPALRAVDRRRTNVGELTVILSQPFTPELLDQVGEGIGPIGLLGTQKETPTGGSQAPKPRSGFQVGRQVAPGVRITTSEGEVLQGWSMYSKSVQIPAATSRFDYTVRNLAALEPIRWGGQEERRSPEAGFFYVASRIVTLNRQLLSTLGQFSGFYWVAFGVVGVVFLIIELVALLIGVQLTRSITTTVDKLHEATKRVKIGDFSHRISLPAHDQLSALGEAFDGMTASVERLLRESLEKTRLEGELEIAREVQRQLFPQAVPEVSGLRLYGVCKPARVVSGDYYDFLRLGENRVGLVLGDISGKGISAALLMAAIQSSLHAQFYNGHFPEGVSGAVPVSTAAVVERLNRQLFASTPREKYATFFYGVYDGVTRKLTYTTAGHLPPVLFRHGSIERLETGGTVVGLFSSVRYEQAVVELDPGDLLLAFTDGLTEPENSYGEEFGEARLLEVAQRALGSTPEALVEEIYRSVSDWTGSPELQDDMTLLVAKAISS